MYIATVPTRTSPPALLLPESYRDGSTGKTRTLANLSHGPVERSHARRRCLNGEFAGLGEATVPVSDRIVAVRLVLKDVAQTVGLVHARGKDRLAKLALLLGRARVAHQGSRLSTVRWAAEPAVAAVLGLAPVDEKALYAALDGLAAHPATLEPALYRAYVQRVGQPHTRQFKAKQLNNKQYLWTVESSGSVGLSKGPWERLTFPSGWPHHITPLTLPSLQEVTR